VTIPIKDSDNNDDAITDVKINRPAPVVKSKFWSNNALAVYKDVRKLTARAFVKFNKLYKDSAPIELIAERDIISERYREFLIKLDN
jgi:hypothetical protein